MDIKEIKQIIKLFNETDISYFQYKNKREKINLTLCSNQSTNKINSTTYDEISCTSDKLSAKINHISKDELNTETIYSKYVGKVILFNEKNSKPYIVANQHVHKGDILAFIQVLNLKIEVYSPADGIISNIFIENGQFVEYNTKLLELMITD